MALTPHDVRELVGAGMGVVVERDAGFWAGFQDMEFRAAGADIAADRHVVCERADLIAWVKKPAFDLNSLPLRSGMRLLGFQDPIARQAEIAELRARGVDSVAFELVPRAGEPTAFDALSAMSRFAGRIAYSEGRQLLSDEARSRPLRSLILGCGRAGLAAIEAAVEFGDEKPAVMGNRMSQEAAAMRCGAGIFLPRADPALVLDHIEREAPDLIVCAATHRGDRAPLLLDGAALEALGAGAVVVDLTAKAGGNCVATRIDATVTLSNGVVVTHSSNYPAAEPREASVAYGAATAAMILRLRDASVGPAAD